jgi:hypothetical protein
MLAACAPADNEPSSIVGFLEDDVIDEASGLAASHNDADTLWVINDDGPAVLHAISSTGKKVARVKLADARNRDWEDLASFRLRGDAYLLVADIGDNLRRRDELTLYLLPEPDTNTSRTSEVRRIRFHYPDGPRDAEAIAVDVAKERALILSKRDIPAVLYSVSLADSADAQQTAVPGCGQQPAATQSRGCRIRAVQERLALATYGDGHSERRFQRHHPDLCGGVSVSARGRRGLDRRAATTT